jgi:hypothetical protein
MGKTALLSRFVEEVPEARDDGGTFVWCFREDRSATAFLRGAAEYFSEGAVKRDPLKQLKLALGGAERHLIVLDGLESIQNTGAQGAALGTLENRAVKRLLQTLATGLGEARGLVTSRVALADLQPWTGGGYRVVNVGPLPRPTSLSLLAQAGIRAGDGELRKLAERLGNHPLSLEVLGRYLKEYHAGSPQSALDPGLKAADWLSAAADIPQASSLSELLSSYTAPLSRLERDLLGRVAAFPDGVEVSTLETLAEEGGKLAGRLKGQSGQALQRMASRLARLGLFQTQDAPAGRRYAVHPWLRQHALGFLDVPASEIAALPVRKAAPARRKAKRARKKKLK